MPVVVMPVKMRGGIVIAKVDKIYRQIIAHCAIFLQLCLSLVFAMRYFAMCAYMHSYNTSCNALHIM